MASLSSIIVALGALISPGLKWEALRKEIPTATISEPLVVDTKLDTNTKPNKSRLTFFRERNGWCPYSERVWLALEAKGLEYDTFLIDNMGARPNWYGGTTPQIQWDDGTRQSESMDIVRKIDDRYPNHGFHLYPDSSAVSTLISEFRNIFPKFTRPSSRSAFLFSQNGEPLFRSVFEKTLDETNALLSQHTSGPYFYGDCFTAADCAWAPFLERYAAQLPILHNGLNPRDGKRWPHLNAWYAAMEQEPQCSFYPCRVQGDVSSWHKVLAQAGYGNAGMTPTLVTAADSTADMGLPAEAERLTEMLLFREYSSTRDHVAYTPAREAASRILRNLASILHDLDKSVGNQGFEDADATVATTSSSSTKISPETSSTTGRSLRLVRMEIALMCTVHLLLRLESEDEQALMDSDVFAEMADAVIGNTLQACKEDKEQGTKRVADVGVGVIRKDLVSVLGYLDHRICVPRDMGVLSAAAIRRLFRLCSSKLR